jgi:cytochrome c oxidase cbb3-type subunit 2
MSHEKLETNIGWMAILIVVVISFGGLAEIVPLMYQAEAIKPLPGVSPIRRCSWPAATSTCARVATTATRRWCARCASRPSATATTRSAGESVYDRPHQWGSKRTGPDLARIGGRYSDDWHRVHLHNPRDVVPLSNMPSYPWLTEAPVDIDATIAGMRALRRLGDPYTQEQIDKAGAELAGKTEQDALVAYLQGLGKNAPRD